MILEDFIVFLDAGHGGIDPVTGEYTTAPNKMHYHGISEYPATKGYFYEGVFNRKIVGLVKDKLDILGIKNILIAHEFVDTPLHQRVDLANAYSRQYKHALYLSSHTNASRSHRAKGFEIFTSVGQTRSDIFATLMYNYVKILLGDVLRMRGSFTDDKDPDKEKDFYVLRKTDMPSALIEYAFFDNKHDVALLEDPIVLNLFAEAQVCAVLQYINTLKFK